MKFEKYFYFPLLSAALFICVFFLKLVHVKYFEIGSQKYIKQF